MSLPPGTAIGRYVVRRKIAEGGMAEIYLCSSLGPEDFHKQVAIKRIRPFLAADASFVEMFIAEASIASQLNHPNVVQIFDFDKHQDTYYLAMEYVRGRTLSQLQNRAKQLLLPIPPLLVARIGSEVARGLDYAHRLTHNGRPLMLVHRDVSPQNILLSYDGAVKLTDFGIAKATTRVTAPGMVKGKFAYMSPEQARGEAVDARTDIFALGTVLWELATGQALFDAPSDVSVLRAVQERHIRPPRSVGVDLPPDLEAAILKALEREPALRFQTAQQMHRALAESAMRHARTLEDTDVGAFLSALFEESPRSDRQPYPEVSHGGPPKGGTLVMMQPEMEAGRGRPPPPEAPVPPSPSEKKPPAPLPATYISPPPVAEATPNAGATLPSFTPSLEGPAAGHTLPFADSDVPHPTAQSSASKPPKTLPIDEPTEAVPKRPAVPKPSLNRSKPTAEGSALDKLLKRARPLLAGDLPSLWPKLAIAAGALLFFALAGLGIHWALSPVAQPKEPGATEEIPPPQPSTPTVIVEKPPPPQPAEPTPPPPPPPKPQSEAPTPETEPTPPPPPPVVESPNEKPPSGRAYGTLVLNLRPWAEVSINNRAYVEVYGRKTYRLPAGTHRIRMRYPGGSKVFEVVIEPGRTFTYEHGPKDK